MQKQGVGADYVSPKVGFVPLVPRSMRYTDESFMKIYESRDFIESALRNSLAPKDVNSDDYSAAADKAKEAINNATTNKDVATEQTKGINAIEAVKVPSLTDSQTDSKDAIDEALNNKKSEINNSNLTDDQK